MHISISDSFYFILLEMITPPLTEKVKGLKKGINNNKITFIMYFRVVIVLYLLQNGTSTANNSDPKISQAKYEVGCLLPFITVYLNSVFDDYFFLIFFSFCFLAEVSGCGLFTTTCWRWHHVRVDCHC